MRLFSVHITSHLQGVQRVYLAVQTKIQIIIAFNEYTMLYFHITI